MLKRSERPELLIEDGHVNVTGHHLKTRWMRHPEKQNLKKQPEDRPVLVFLHEGLGSIELWGIFPKTMVSLTGLDGFLYDRLGHGGSDPLPSPAVDVAFQDTEAWHFLPAVLGNSHIRRCIFIGHSDGGTIALLYAARHGEKVAGIITEAAHVFVDPMTVQGAQNAVLAYQQADLRKKLAKYHGGNIDSMFRRWADTWCSQAFRSWNIEALLSQVHCPVLAIQGLEDEYGIAEQAKSIAANVGGDSELWLVPQCRHVPHLQARRAVVDRCTQFINYKILGR